MLTSTMSAPMPSTICAAAAIFSGSPPKIWIETGRSSSVYSAYSSVRSMPRTSPSELTISVTTSPQPPRRFTSRRKAVSVIPAIGASANDGATFTVADLHDAVDRQYGLHVGGVDFDADRLADQIHREDQAGRARPCDSGARPRPSAARASPPPSSLHGSAGTGRTAGRSRPAAGSRRSQPRGSARCRRRTRRCSTTPEHLRIGSRSLGSKRAKQ